MSESVRIVAPKARFLPFEFIADASDQTVLGALVQTKADAMVEMRLNEE